jgi:hypothetical protein
MAQMYVYRWLRVSPCMQTTIGIITQPEQVAIVYLIGKIGFNTKILLLILVFV